MPVFNTIKKHVPESLKEYDHWVLWGLDEEGRKRPLAPWVRGDLYPVKWGSNAPERPETDWETAYRHWQNREGYSTPAGMDPENTLPAPLLLHDPLNPPLMQVDFDDVRNPETAQVTGEVCEIVDRLDAFCEISQSGKGLHLFVRAELPGQLGKFIAGLHDTGDIELYDHGRAVGATWDHVEGTPTDVPERQDVVEDIIREYEDSSQRKRRIGKSESATHEYTGDIDLQATSTDSAGNTDNISPYFKIDIRDVSDTGHFCQHRRRAPGDDWTGPHPAHGPQKSDPDECTNFGVVPSKDVWFCFAHGTGGRTIELAAVLCPKTDISCGDAPGENESVGGWLRGQPLELLTTCLWLRKQRVVSVEAKPPYDALLGAAQLADLHIRDPSEGIIGDANKEIARAVFDDLDYDDL